MKRTGSATSAITIVLGFLLCSCASGGGSSGGGSVGSPSTPTTKTTSNYTTEVLAPDQNGLGPLADVQYAEPGGPTFVGAGPAPAVGTAYPVNQIAMSEELPFPNPNPVIGGGPDTIVTLPASGVEADVVTLTKTATGYQFADPTLDFYADLPPPTAIGSKQTSYLVSAGTFIGLSATSYELLGVWQLPNSRSILRSVFLGGYQTPAAGVPTTGTAHYSGTNNVFGYVYAPGYNGFSVGTVQGNGTLDINFATRSVTGALTNMTAQDGNSVWAWNKVSLSAQLGSSGASDAAGFNGTVTAGGNPGGMFGIVTGTTGVLDGHVFGPSANEVGALWSLYDGTHAVTGAVGATQ